MPGNGNRALTKWLRWLLLGNEGFGRNPSLQKRTDQLLEQTLQAQLRSRNRSWQRDVNLRNSVFSQAAPGCCQSLVRHRGTEYGSG